MNNFSFKYFSYGYVNISLDSLISSPSISKKRAKRKRRQTFNCLTIDRSLLFLTGAEDISKMKTKEINNLGRKCESNY